MSAPILATKLYIPPPRPEIVTRPRLLERLNAGLPAGHKLTLISAPAGFGKTTLVSSWSHLKDEGGRMKDESRETLHPSSLILHPSRVAWLSLDEGDNDPTRFLVYLVAALQTLAPTMGVGALAALQTPQPPSSEAILTTLLNEIAAVPEPFLLVLDDYHLIEAQPVHQALTFLLEHLPPRMHLVIATREDPGLPLARLRARGQLTELRAADLRFTPAEAAEFLNRMMGLHLSAEEIAALDARTEGWIAGLQLAALSMQGQADTAGFIKSFTGSHRFVLDYLVEEVLHRQPENIQTFLLRTSILDRLCGPLCDAVLSRGAEEQGCRGDKNISSAPLLPCPPACGQKTLEYLERANLFLVPLDNERRWYRYHHLFGGFLRQRLRQSDASSTGDEGRGVAEYHSRASLWYEKNGYEAEAFHHAVAAEDFERAAGLVELSWQAMDSSFQSAAWLGWVKKLPDELIRTRPVLSTQAAFALTDAGELEASESRLRDAERWLDTPGAMNAQAERSAEGMVVVDEAQFRTLPARIAIVHAYNAQIRGDVASTVKYTELALKLTPAEDHFGRAQATVILEVTHWASGNLEAARRAIADWMSSMQQAGNIVFAVASAFALADIMVAQGHLHEAVKTYQQALQLALGDKEAQKITAHHYLGLAMLSHEMDDQAAAAQHLQKAREMGEQTTLVDWPYRWRLAQARLKEAEGDLEAALDLLDEAKRRYIRNPLPDTSPIEALKARVWIKQGRLTQTLDWALERGLSADDDLSYLREFEHITLARALIAGYKRDRADRSLLEAMGLLTRLLKAADEGGRTGSVIEILVLQALAHEAQGHIPLALAPLERALALAEPEGYVRIFVDEGLPIAELLTRMKACEAGGTLRVKELYYKLLAAFGKPKEIHPASRSLTRSVHSLVEPLSQRELEILQLIAQGLSNREISERLFLALDTVKGHTRRIFGKLQVQRRTEAVARARELGLL